MIGNQTRKRVRLELAVAALLSLGCRVAAGGGLPEAEARSMLGALEGPSSEAARGAIERIVAARDQRFVAVFVELIRASELGSAAPAPRRRPPTL